MVRRSFRVGLRLGLLIGIGFALVKTVQSRRSTPAAPPPPAPWKPIVDTPVDEVGEPIEEPGPAAESESGLDVPLAAEPKPVKKAAKKAAKVTKATAAATPPPAWVEAEGGVCPPTHPVKAKVKSKLFHLPGMFAYDRTNPDRCYTDAPTAEAEGFVKAKR
ncbi:MAG: hypothetical protein QOF60_3141 [Actinomycetota bacterium]|jgi:hypothetical protein|nr:hypothetical protein [Actinomycetota bacterium]